jgi:hypothetical protein
MAITKEMFFQCLEEGKYASDLLKMIIDETREMILKEVELDEWQAFGNWIVAQKPAEMTESKIRYELMKRRWKTLQGQQHLQVVLRRVKTERKIEAKIENTFLIREQMDRMANKRGMERYDDLSEEEKDKIASTIALGDYTVDYKAELILRMIRKIIREKDGSDQVTVCPNEEKINLNELTMELYQSKTEREEIINGEVTYDNEELEDKEFWKRKADAEKLMEAWAFTDTDYRYSSIYQRKDNNLWYVEGTQNEEPVGILTYRKIREHPKHVRQKGGSTRGS